MPKPTYFIVTCHGWSGSHWLASALNMHPDILCCHSAMNIPATKQTWEDNKLQKTIDEREVARSRRGQASTDILLSEVESYGVAKSYGNVHTLRARDLVDLDTYGPQKKSCLFANLVRHPVSVVASGAGQFEDMISWDIHALIESSDAVREVIDIAKSAAIKFGLNLCDPSIRSFITASQHLTHLARDQRIAPTIKTILMERVTTEKDYFLDILNYLANGNVDISNEYLDSVFAIGKLNSHKQKNFSTPVLLYESWEPWKKYIFNEVVQQQHINELYAPLGYDLSFIKEVRST